MKFVAARQRRGSVVPPDADAPATGRGGGGVRFPVCGDYGMVSTWPGWIRSGFAMPFASAMRWYWLPSP